MSEDFDRAQGVQPEGFYANYFSVGYNAFEFVMDFSQQFPGSEKAPSRVRVVTGPAYAKAFLRVLQDSIEKYESAYGGIADDR